MHQVCHETLGLRRYGPEARVASSPVLILSEGLGGAVSFIQFSQLSLRQPTALSPATRTHRTIAFDFETVLGRSARFKMLLVRP